MMLAEYIENLYSILPGCLLFRTTGFYCPACGGTRAFVAFLKGEFITSFYYHSFIDITALYFAYKLLHLLIFYIAQRVFGQDRVIYLQRKTDIPVKGYLIIALVFTLGQWIIKNLMVLYFYH